MRLKTALKTHKYLLGPTEKAKIVSIMRASPLVKHAKAWAMEFHRLPETIRKIATEAGVTLRD